MGWGWDAKPRGRLMMRFEATCIREFVVRYAVLPGTGRLRGGERVREGGEGWRRVERELEGTGRWKEESAEDETGPGV